MLLLGIAQLGLRGCRFAIRVYLSVAAVVVVVVVVAYLLSCLLILLYLL